MADIKSGIIYFIVEDNKLKVSGWSSLSNVPKNTTWIDINSDDVVSVIISQIQKNKFKCDFTAADATAAPASVFGFVPSTLSPVATTDATAPESVFSFVNPASTPAPAADVSAPAPGPAVDATATAPESVVGFGKRASTPAPAADVSAPAPAVDTAATAPESVFGFVKPASTSAPAADVSAPAPADPNYDLLSELIKKALDGLYNID